MLSKTFKRLGGKREKKNKRIFTRTTKRSSAEGRRGKREEKIETISTRL